MLTSKRLLAIGARLPVNAGKWSVKKCLLFALGELAADAAQSFQCHTQVRGDEFEGNAVQQLALGSDKMFVFGGGFCEPCNEGALFRIAVIFLIDLSANNIRFRKILVEILQIIVMKTGEFAIFDGLYILRSDLLQLEAGDGRYEFTLARYPGGDILDTIFYIATENSFSNKIQVGTHFAG